MREWLDDNDDKPGHNSKPTKSNTTDNDSAKMKTSNGTIQGYNGVAMVDDKHQVIVGAEVFGESTEYNLLEPMIKVTRENFSALEKEEDVFQDAKLTVDSGFPVLRGVKRAAFTGQKRHCRPCKLRAQCLRFPDRTEVRQVTLCPWGGI